MPKKRLHVEFEFVGFSFSGDKSFVLNLDSDAKLKRKLKKELVNLCVFPTIPVVI